MAPRVPLRWVAMGIFTLSSALAFLDRQVLAALAPLLREELHLSNEGYGYILSVFSITYAASAPAMGLLVDRLGLDRAASAAVGLWSLAGMATGLVRGFAGLAACRAALGITQAAGIPASGKAAALYLLPQERALGSAFSQIGISLGMVSAPLIAAWLSVSFGWRSVFLATGALGFLWIPLWLAFSRSVPAAAPSAASTAPRISAMLRDRGLWGLAGANILCMTIYSLWMNWTTVFLVDTQGMDQATANRSFAWIPPVFAAAGGLAGGWLSMRLADSGVELIAARKRVCLASAVALLLTATTPFLPSPALATAAICWSFFWTVALSANLYALPLDIYGAQRAAFGVSILTFAYGVMQTFLSPLIGLLIDRYGFTPVCAAVALMPLAAVAVLKITERPS